MTITRDLSIPAQQRQFFATGKTLPIDFRIEQLKKIKSLLQSHESEIIEALHKDLHRAPMETFMSESMLIIEEINFIIKNLKKWASPTKTRTPFPLLWPGRSSILYEPYGSVLIIGPWNYPLQLVMSPLVGAIAAGNCVVIKPSEISSHTQELIIRLINDNFLPQYITAIQAGPEQVEKLLKNKFDYIFFTGGTQIGKIIMQAAANQLTPVTLELGGKSPCIVDETANLDFAARRIVWGKMLNAGQTCIAPDYLYIHRSCKEALINKMKTVITQFYGEDPEKSDSYGRIIDKKHFERIVKLMQNGKIIFGGQVNEANRYISPTLIDDITWDSPIMQEEIFGPLLPILTFDNLAEVTQAIQARPKPLSLYLFTNNKVNEKLLLSSISFGGGCINDCIFHICNYHLPFGGISYSGMGSYHGKFSFETFSHRKAIYKKTLPIDFSFQYPPYTKRKFWWLRWLLRC